AIPRPRGRAPCGVLKDTLQKPGKVARLSAGRARLGPFFHPTEVLVAGCRREVTRRGRGPGERSGTRALTPVRPRRDYRASRFFRSRSKSDPPPSTTPAACGPCPRRAACR